MKKLLLSGLEAALNYGINLDPIAKEKTVLLHNKVIKIELTDIELVFFITIKPDNIAVDSMVDDPVSTIISGDIPSFIKIGIKQGSRSSILSSDMTISGDLAVAEQLSSLLKSLNIDWEYHLAKYTGDTVASKTCHHINKFKQTTSRTWRSLSGNIKEYLLHEVGAALSADEVLQHYRDIIKLREDVERLEARILCLQQSNK